MQNWNDIAEMLAKSGSVNYNNGTLGEGRTAMTNAESVKKHHAKLDEFKIRPYLEEGKKIREFAAQHNVSIQELFLSAVRDIMEKEESRGRD